MDRGGEKDREPLLGAENEAGEVLSEQQQQDALLREVLEMRDTLKAIQDRTASVARDVEKLQEENQILDAYLANVMQHAPGGSSSGHGKARSATKPRSGTLSRVIVLDPSEKKQEQEIDPRKPFSPTKETPPTALPDGLPVQTPEFHECDRFGFQIDPACLDFYHLQLPGLLARLDRQEERWNKCFNMRTWQENFEMLRQRSYPLLSELVHGGIPSELRSEVWEVFLGAKRNREGATYMELVQKAEQHASKESLDEIDADIGRNFQTHGYLSGEGKGPLRRVLMALAQYDESIQYVPAICLLAGGLLLFMEEEVAFWSLVSMVTELMSDYFKGSGCFTDVCVLDDIVAQQLPHLRKRFDLLEFELGSVTSPWFMTLFSSVLPWEVVFRLWDIAFFEQKLDIVYRAGLAILKIHEEAFLLCQDKEMMARTARRIQQTECVDADRIIKAAFRIGDTIAKDITTLRSRHQPTTESFLAPEAATAAAGAAAVAASEDAGAAAGAAAAAAAAGAAAGAAAAPGAAAGPGAAPAAGASGAPPGAAAVPAGRKGGRASLIQSEWVLQSPRERPQRGPEGDESPMPSATPLERPGGGPGSAGGAGGAGGAAAVGAGGGPCAPVSGSGIAAGMASTGQPLNPGTISTMLAQAAAIGRTPMAVPRSGPVPVVPASSASVLALTAAAAAATAASSFAGAGGAGGSSSGGACVSPPREASETFSAAAAAAAPTAASALEALLGGPVAALPPAVVAAATAAAAAPFESPFATTLIAAAVVAPLQQTMQPQQQQHQQQQPQQQQRVDLLSAAPAAGERLPASIRQDASPQQGSQQL